MIQYGNIQKAMGTEIAISREMAEAIYRWNKMYVNKAPWLNKDVKSLNLPASICQEIARLVTMEAKIEITGSQRAKYINESLKRFLERLPFYTELCCNAGGIVFKPYLENGRISIDVVRAGYYYPTAFDSAGDITGIIFPEFKRVGRKLYTRLEYQHLEGNRYIVENKAFVSRKAIVKTDNIIHLGQEIKLEDVPEWADLSPYEEFVNADTTLFSHFKIPIANNIDPDSPLGVSVYERAVNQIKDADEQYGAALWEYKAKETAIQAADEFFRKNRKGEPILPKGKERIYSAMGPNITGKEDVPFFNVYSPEIRDQSFFNGYNKIVQKVEFNSGLAYGTLSDPQVVSKTAEEIKSSKQRSFATVKAIQNSLEDAIVSLVAAIEAWLDMEEIVPADKVKITCDWDDSIVADKQAKRDEDRKDVSMGVMRLEEYRAKYYGETIEEALKNLPVQNTVLE